MILLLAQGWAGVPVHLPTSEDPSAWRSAMELADLESAPRAEAAIVIEPSTAAWIVTVTSPDGRTRTAQVSPPATPGEREEVALLALALARELGVAPRPRPLLVPPVAPPQPVDAPEPVPAPVPTPPAPRPAPIVDPEPPPAVEPAPEPVVPPPDPVPQGDADVVPAVGAGEPVVPAPTETSGPVLPSRRLTREPREPREPRERPGIAVAPLYGGLGWVARPAMQSGARVFGGVVAAGPGPFRLQVELGVVPARRLGMAQQTETPQGTVGLSRRLVVGDLQMAAGLAGSERLHLEGVAGVAWHSHLKQGVTIDRRAIPFVGAGLEAGVLQLGGWTVPVRARGLFDVVQTRLVDDTGRAWKLGFFELELGVAIRFRGAGDPSPPVPTSRGR